MTRGIEAALGVAIVAFGFDLDPATPPARALHVWAMRRGLPRAEVAARERLGDAALRAIAEAGLPVDGRRARGGARLHLVGFDDTPGRSRELRVWYYVTAPFATVGELGGFVPVRGARLDEPDASALAAALDRLRADTRHVAGAAALAGGVFTGDDLLRVHTALHGGPEGSERTFRRRVQELRDAGILRALRSSEALQMRERIPRFRSPAGTGGRPPELLRYAGPAAGGGEQLASLRARRSAS